MRIEMDRFNLEIPTGWSLVVGSDHASIRLFYNSDVHQDAHQSTVEWTGADIGLRLVPVPIGETIQSYAEAMMKRHVRQGEPERYSQLVGGRSAYAYSWTDGVNNIDTYFVEESAGVVLRIDLAIAAHPNYSATAKRARSSAGQIIGTFAWSGSSA